MRAAAAAGLLFLLLAAGCAAWDPAYRFQPAPAVLTLRAGDVLAGRVEATVVGAREAEGSGPATVHVRVRVERYGETSVAAPPGSMVLLAADGRRLTVHDVDPPTGRAPAIGGAETCTVAFALPQPADLDDVWLSRLELYLWTQVGGDRRLGSVTFEREMREHPWWNPWGAGPE